MSALAVFVNPRARKGRSAARAQTAITALRDLRGSDAVELVNADSTAAVRAEAGRLVRAGCERIVVLGGDGLVHHVTQAVAGSDTVMGVVPIGSGNDLAMALGLPGDPAAAARVALGAARPIDLLRTTSTEGSQLWAVSVATVGFSAAVNERAEALRWPRGSARYSLATMLELPGLQCRPMVMTLEGPDGTIEQHRLDAALVAVANTSCFGGGMRICPAARPDDGLADVTVIGSVGRLSLLAHFARVFRGTHVRHHAVSTFRASALSLASADAGAGTGAGAGAIRADGEAWTQLPARIEVVPAALWVAAPGDQ
ncbi:MAG: diacylglycerol/lipid kinase family protein [Acidimicrobiales bacterium]